MNRQTDPKADFIHTLRIGGALLAFLLLIFVLFKLGVFTWFGQHVVQHATKIGHDSVEASKK